MTPAPPAENAAAPWLAELRAHPTHHDLLAAFDLLHRSANLTQRPASPPESAADHDLSQSTPDFSRSNPDLSQSTPDFSRSTSDLSQSTPEPVRFTHSTELALPLGELLAVTPDPDNPTRHLLTTAGAGPCGPDSPLPLALADELADDPLALAVLDLFHHRRTLLLCRGLLTADLAGALDTRTGADPWSRRIIALIGLADAPLTPLEALRLAPLLISGDRSPRLLALALRRLLPALAQTSTPRLEPVDDVWTPLADEHHSRLGDTTARLGHTAALGTTLRLPSAAARLHLGPLPAAALPALRPGQPAHARLGALLALFIPEPIAIDLVVELDHLSIPPCLLGQQALGEDLFLTPNAAATRLHRLTIPLTPA